MLLKDRVGVVTGASSGMGRASALRFAKEGALLTLIDVADLSVTKNEILDAVPTAEVLCLAADIADEGAVEDAMEQTALAFGRLDFAFNNAGVMMTRSKVGDVDSASWERVVRINLFGSFYCAKHEIRQMLKAGTHGSIIFNASVGGLIGTPSASDYVCSKHAIIGLMKSVMCDYADAGIRANAICPGQIETPMWENVNSSAMADPDAYARLNRTQNPMRRLGLPEEVAALAAFLASDESSHITGTAIPVDGGHVATNASYFDWS
ncbi:MAG: SDR family oxidoreductase [Oscillospiraceae bacterium]|nr:SDR family oxidoreductase [Oscillospiraceae bacterium]